MQHEHGISNEYNKLHLLYSLPPILFQDHTMTPEKPPCHDPRVPSDGTWKWPPRSAHSVYEEQKWGADLI